MCLNTSGALLAQLSHLFVLIGATALIACSAELEMPHAHACTRFLGCGGFNYPHGILKQTDCYSNMAYEQSVDLYLVESSPQPPPMV